MSICKIKLTLIFLFKSNNLFLIVTLFYLSFSTSSFAQIHSLSPIYYHYDSTNSNIAEFDWTFLDNHIDGKRLVFLGEDHHRVSEFNFLKANVIQHFVKEKGFSVVLFESPSESAFLGFSDTKTTPQSLGDSGLLATIWAVAENHNLFQMLLDSESSVRAGGFDCQNMMISKTKKSYKQMHFGQIIRNSSFLSDTLRDAISRTDSNFFELVAKNVGTPDWKHTHIGYTVSYSDTIAYMVYIAAAKNLYNQYKEELSMLPQLNTVNEKLFRMYMQNRIWSLEQKIDPSQYRRRRDEQMAANIVYLADSVFPGKKIIIWAHDGHIGKKPMDHPYLRSTTSMFLPESILSQSYIIALKMGKLLMNDGKFEKIYRTEFEDRMYLSLEKGGDAFFVDLHATPSLNFRNKKLTNYYDAIFYVKNVHSPHFTKKTAK